jgi:hypothetical protein
MFLTWLRSYWWLGKNWKWFWALMLNESAGFSSNVFVTGNNPLGMHCVEARDTTQIKGQSIPCEIGGFACCGAYRSFWSSLKDFYLWAKDWNCVNELRNANSGLEFYEVLKDHYYFGANKYDYFVACSNWLEQFPVRNRMWIFVVAVIAVPAVVLIPIILLCQKIRG